MRRLTPARPIRHRRRYREPGRAGCRTGHARVGVCSERRRTALYWRSALRACARDRCLEAGAGIERVAGRGFGLELRCGALPPFVLRAPSRARGGREYGRSPRRARVYPSGASTIRRAEKSTRPPPRAPGKVPIPSPACGGGPGWGQAATPRPQRQTRVHAADFALNPTGND